MGKRKKKEEEPGVTFANPKILASEISAAAIHTAPIVGSSSGPHISASPPAAGGIVIGPGSIHFPGVAASGTYSTDPVDGAEEEAERAAKEQPLVVLPTKKPKKVLVAFIDDDGEGATDPYWAAYLEPQDLDLFLGGDDARDASMVLRLALVKKYEQ